VSPSLAQCLFILPYYCYVVQHMREIWYSMAIRETDRYLGVGTPRNVKLEGLRQ
jgi:hypothetical protein